jgi:hypothetical protein
MEPAEVAKTTNLLLLRALLVMLDALTTLALLTQAVAHHLNLSTLANLAPLIPLDAKPWNAQKTSIIAQVELPALVINLSA